MTERFSTLALLAILALGATAPAAASENTDRVTLTSGERLEGEFVSADRDAVRLRVGGALRTLPRDEVRRIDFQRESSVHAGAPRKLVVETGLAIEVKLRSSLSSHVSRNGESFTAELLSPITTVDGEVLAAPGDTVWGRVVHAQRYRPPANRGVLDIELSEVHMAGRVRIIKTTLGRVVGESVPPAGADDREQRLGPGALVRFTLSQPITIRPSRY